MLSKSAHHRSEKVLLMLERMGGSEGGGCRVEGDKYRKMIVIQKGSVDGPNALSLSCVIRDTPALETRQ